MMKNAKLSQQIVLFQRADRRLAQAALRLDRTRQRVADGERRARDRRLFELGSLVEMVGLLVCDQDVLLGAMLRARPLLDDADYVRSWRSRGRQILTDRGNPGKGPIQRTAGIPAQATKPVMPEKARYWRLIVAGGTIEAAGFAGVDEDIVLGILAVIARRIDDPVRAASWKIGGARHRAATA